MIIFGTKGRSIKMDSGEFHCPNCNDNRVYNKKYVQDWFTLYFIPTFPVGGKKNEHIECEECSSIYHLDVIDYKPGLNDEEMTSEYEKALQNVLCLMIIADDLVIEFKNSGNYLIGSIIARIMYLDNDFYKCSSKEKVILSDLNNFLKKMQIILIMVLINMKQIKLENQKELGILFNLKMEVGGFIWSV